jgi:penicillin-binding protein 2
VNEEHRIHQNFQGWRLTFVIGLAGAVLLYYMANLFQLQILEGADYIARADENRITEINIPTQRGVIYDRNGFVLARNVASFNVVVTPALLPLDEGAIQNIYRELSPLLGVPVSTGELTDEEARLFKPCDNELGITQIVLIQDSNAPYTGVPVSCDVSQEVAMRVREKGTDWPGVSVEVESVRDYPTGELTSEIIGFLGPIPAALEEEYRDLRFVPNRDKVGYAGVEFSLQEELGGANGIRVVEVDVAGQELRDLETPVDPVAGNNIELTIDTRLQSLSKNIVKKELAGWNAYLGEERMSVAVAVAMNPKTGEILSMVSYPTYENNRMARVIPAYYYEQLTRDPKRPLFNHAISAEHPPGSVYKMAAWIGAMNENVVAPQKTLLCPEAGKITITQKFTPNDPGTPRDYVCWEDTGHGLVNAPQAIAYSCDVWFYKVSGGFEGEVPQGLGVWRMADYSRILGYGEVTGLELPGESNGLVPDPTWKRINVGENWSTGDTYIASMGQGYVLSTPMQVLASFAILANDGKYMRPTLVHQILDSENNVIQPFEPELRWDITKDAMINVYDEDNFPTGEMKVVEPWVIELAQEGMRLVVTKTDTPTGTASREFAGMSIPSAGKTGTAEYCDNVAQEKDLCKPGNWPAHAWYAGYAPYDDPEIAVVAFVYNGGEGASVAAPIVRQIMEGYFELKAIDTTAATEE